MKNDTINYFLFFNDEEEVLIFRDINSGEILYPQNEEKTLEENFETRIAKMTMLLKEKSSINDVLLMQSSKEVSTRKISFMNEALELLEYEDSKKIDSYNGEYKLIEYSSGKYFFEVEYLLCNYYAKYIKLEDKDIDLLKTLCKSYGYEIDFIKINTLLNADGEEFALSRRYLRKLDRTLKYEID